MRAILLALIAAALAAPAPLGARATLTPAGRIGVGWRPNLWEIDKFGWMSFVAFDATGKRVVSDGPTAPEDVDDHLALWTFPGGRLVRRIDGGSPQALSPDGRHYATRGEVRRLSDGAVVLGGTVDLVQAFTPDGHHVVQTGPGLGTRIVDLAAGHSARSLASRSAFSLAVSPDGGTLASGHWDAVALTDIASGTRRAMLRGIGRYVKGLAFSRDGRRLAVATDAGGLQIWDVRGHARLHSLELPGGEVSTPAFSPNGRWVAVGVYGTGAVWLVDTRRGRVVASRKVSDIGCGSVAFSPDGRFLIAPSTGGLITWPYDKGGTVRVFRVRG